MTRSESDLLINTIHNLKVQIEGLKHYTLSGAEDYDTAVLVIGFSAMIISGLLSVLCALLVFGYKNFNEVLDEKFKLIFSRITESREQFQANLEAATSVNRQKLAELKAELTECQKFCTNKKDKK